MWDFMMAFRLPRAADTIEHYRDRISHLGIAIEIHRVHEDRVWLGFKREAHSVELAVNDALKDSGKLLLSAELASLTCYSHSQFR